MKEDKNLPPQSIEAEQSVLGGLLLDNSVYDKITERVSGKDFYRQEHKIIFATICDLLDSGKPVDPITLRDHLKECGELNQVGGDAYIYQLLRNTPTAVNAHHYADIVRKKSMLRNAIETSQKVIFNSHNPDEKQAQEIVQEAISDFIEISENNGPREVKEARHLISKVLADIDSRAARGGTVGLSTGYSDLDRFTHGFHNGELIILAGRPSSGKTTAAINIAENVAIKETKSVLVFSLEMTAEQLIERSLSSIAKVESSRLKSGIFTQDDCDKMSYALPSFSNSKLFIDDRPMLGINEMRLMCRKVKKDHGLSLVIVDYITLMAGDGENEVIRIGNLSRGLKLLARELEVPVIAISQLNRQVESRADKRPLMADLRSSGAIEQDADLILFIYREDYYYPDSPNRNIAELIISKNRSGETGTLNLFFNKNYCRFDPFCGTYVKYKPTETKQPTFSSEY